jgi:hypothetical protein
MRPAALSDKTKELGSGTATPGMRTAPSVVPKEKVTAVIVVSAVIPEPEIVNMAD